MLDEIFVPNLLGVSSVAHTARVLFSLLAKLTGLGVRNPVKISNLVFSILCQEDFNQHEISKEKT